MAPESSTQTDAQPINSPNPALPPNAQQPAQTYAQQQQPGFQQDPRSYGPPYAPYQQQPVQQQWTPPRVPETKAWMITKIALHGVDIVSCIIGLALTGAIRRTETLGLIALGACPIFVVAMIWDIAEIATRFGRKWKAGIHPGAHVAMSLFIWLAASVVGGIESTLSFYWSDFDYLDESCEYDRREGRYVCTNTGKVASKHALFVALSVFTCLVWLWHFILFVGACIDTQKRNAAMKRPVTMVFGGPAYWGPGAQGFQQVPQYYMPPQGQQIPMQNWAPQQNGNGKEPMTTAQPQPTAERYA
ncbi:hypothetical protein F53441_7135 [Fusarium austroafricanum]|uniref:MARVEL domain-containing protein n=1 Tax=Fusarium austroafricanum TaxID=2364996 RepID=A0A8H4KH35_9HYPO|nr:hypothetical protein F53441_7135 [Fusarium austroafricanum]